MGRGVGLIRHLRDPPPNRLPRGMWFDRYVLLEGLQPATEIFRIDEAFVTVFATDALAERVMQAGCAVIAPQPVSVRDGYSLRIRESSFCEQKEAKKLHPLESRTFVQTPGNEVFCALFYKKALLPCYGC